MNRISFKGVIIGGMVDIFGSTLAALPLLVYAFIAADIGQLPQAAQVLALLDTIQNTLPLYLTVLVLGAAGSVFGGYLAALIAKHDEVLHGALSAFLCIALGVYSLLKGTVGGGPWTHALFFALSPALGAFGGYLRVRRRYPRRPDIPIGL